MNQPSTTRRPGRGPRSEGDSRADILKAARALFAARGFQGTTTRAVAERAGVDASLIHHFFGSKAALFAAAVELPRVAAELEAHLSGPAGEAAEAVARLYVEQLFTRDIETFSAMLRTALGSPEAMPQLRRMLTETMTRVVVAALPGADALLRAQLVGAQMIGVLVLRHLIGVEPIASTPADELIRRLGPALRALLEADEEPS